MLEDGPGSSCIRDAAGLLAIRRITDAPEDGLGSSCIRDAVRLNDATLSRKRRLKRRKGVYYARKLRNMAHAYARGDFTLDALNASVQGWANHVRSVIITGDDNTVNAEPKD